MGNCKHAKWGMVLFLVAGLVHLIPQLYTWLTGLTGGTPWVQIIVGALVVIFSLMGLFGKGCGMCEHGTTGTTGSTM